MLPMQELALLHSIQKEGMHKDKELENREMNPKTNKINN